MVYIIVMFFFLR